MNELGRHWEPEISQRQDAEATAEKALKILSEPMTVAGYPLEVTSSIGIAIANPNAPLTPAELLVQADGAMYAAKKAGRNRYCFAD